MFTCKAKIVHSNQQLYNLVPFSLDICLRLGDRGGTAVKVLHYKSEGHWFDPRWCHWNFSLT